MYSRLDDVPVLESRPSQLDARHFNHVQHALNQLGDSVRLPIPRLKHLDLILERQAWVIVDRMLHDIPVAAWTDFATQRRDNLHQPIQCTLRLYHIHAHLVLKHTLEAMELLLGEQLQDRGATSPASVTSIRQER